MTLPAPWRRPPPAATPERGQWVDFQDIPSGCTCRWDTPLRTGVGRVTGGNGLNGVWMLERADPACPRHGEGGR